MLHQGHVALTAEHLPAFKPVSADWTTPAMRSRIRGGRRQILARALGLVARTRLRVLDATAGLGRDGFVLAALGAEVTLAERQPLVAELLRDAQRRARESDSAMLREAADRVRIVGSDAREMDAAQGPFDAAHLDPMYPHAGRRALPQKEMQLLRALAGDDEDAGALLAHLRSFIPRVAVKRPDGAPYLDAQTPDFSLDGTQTRFDVYLRRA